MACSITPISPDLECPKEVAPIRPQTIWGEVERVERGFQRGAIYLRGAQVFDVNKAVPKWIRPGIGIEINIGNSEATIRQI